MNNLSNLIYRTLDEMIALYPEPRAASTIDGEKTPPILPAPSLSGSPGANSGGKPVTPMDPVQIRRRWALDDARLRCKEWNDSQLRAIDSEELAALAFDTSDKLKAEFHDKKSTFLAYWRSLREN